MRSRTRDDIDGVYVTLSDGSEEFVTHEELQAAAEMFDRLRDEIDEERYGITKRGHAMSTTPTVQDLWEHMSSWRQVLEGKGYNSVNCDLKFDAENDEIRFSMWWYDTEWSSTYLPQDLQKCGRFELAKRLIDITSHVNAQDAEHVARDNNLLKDYAKIKERIDKSHLADRLKAEAQALMDAMTTNILPAPADVTEAEIEAQISAETPDVS